MRGYLAWGTYLVILVEYSDECLLTVEPPSNATKGAT